MRAALRIVLHTSVRLSVPSEGYKEFKVGEKNSKDTKSDVREERLKMRTSHW